MRKYSPGRPKKIDPNVIKVAESWVKNELSVNETKEQLKLFQTVQGREITTGMVRYAVKTLGVIDHESQ